MEETAINQALAATKPQYNQKPRTLARILSGLVDMFLVFLCGFLFIQLEMAAPISKEYHTLKDELITIVDETKLETDYGHKLYEDEENYSLYTTYHRYQEADETSENNGKFYVVINNETISDEAKTNYQASIKSNSIYQSHYLTYRLHYYGLTMLAVGVSEIVLVLVIPLTNKRRATLGRFVAMTTLIDRKEVKAKWWQILIRFLFVLLVETALPLFYLSEFGAFIIVALINLFVTLISRKSDRTLRDYVSLTRIIDKNSFKPINEQ